jgi:hypothetical protein
MSTPKFNAPLFDRQGLYAGVDAPLVKNHVLLPVGDRHRVPQQIRVFTVRAMYVGDWLVEVFVEDGTDMNDRHVVGNIFHALMVGAWDDGYTAGHSRAMRRMSDEPNVEPAVNPYRD